MSHHVVDGDREAEWSFSWSWCGWVVFYRASYTTDKLTNGLYWLSTVRTWELEATTSNMTRILSLGTSDT